MNARSSLLLNLTARVLEPREREVVLGDLAEAEADVLRSIGQVLDLGIRRHAALWTSWRPWLTGPGLTVPGSFLLVGVSLTIALALMLAMLLAWQSDAQRWWTPPGWVVEMQIPQYAENLKSLRGFKFDWRRSDGNQDHVYANQPSPTSSRNSAFLVKRKNIGEGGVIGCGGGRGARLYRRVTVLPPTPGSLVVST